MRDKGMKRGVESNHTDTILVVYRVSLHMITIYDISFVFGSLFIVPNRDDFHICSSLAYK